MKDFHSISVMALVMGLILSAVSGYFSVIGLATIFSGAFVSVLVMASVLELSKVIAASWIYRCWGIAPKIMRIYMTIAVIVLIGITSMGIFGYLSKAHLEQTLNVQGSTNLQIETYEQQVSVQQDRIDEAANVLAILDGEIKTLQEYDRIRGPDGAIAVRKSQETERSELNNVIYESRDEIASIKKKMLPLYKEKIEQESEIGPLKYLAEAIYGEEKAKEHFDAAVRMIIIIIVCVFDPLAITLLIAGNAGIMASRPKKRTEKLIKFLSGDEIFPPDRESRGLDG